MNNVLDVNGIKFDCDTSNYLGTTDANIFIYSYADKWRNTVAKVYTLKFFDKSNIIRNFIPCYSTTTVTNVDEQQCSKNTKVYMI